jgi:tetratricopeptide (TPR) repeat protein
MADIFISYTSSDRDWAFWIAKELEALGDTPHVHEWEIRGGEDIYAWMERRHDSADHVLCIVSDDYLKAPYSTLERNAALWQSAQKRPGFVILVTVEPCKLPTLSDHIRRCELFGVPEEIARTRFRAFMSARTAVGPHLFPGKAFAVSNIPVRVPMHFLGRDASLEGIHTAFGNRNGCVAIAALHGLRGVGKTTLAAAYADRHRCDYRATWWIRSQTEAALRADLVALGVRLNWVAPDEKEEPALAAVLERLRHEGEGILLIYDNAISADALKPYLPSGGEVRVLVTSNSHAWRGIAAPIEIHLWPREIGANYLIARTGREKERPAAETLSHALGGLPLAHEQAAAYCERLELSLREYRKRFETAPSRILDDERDAPTEYHDRLTVTKTFALAITEAAKLHSAAEPLIVHAALLATEPIPLFLFAEAREKFERPLAAALVGDNLDEAIAALRSFALIDRETIVDERDPQIETEAIRVHPLVRQVAASRCVGESKHEVHRALVEAITSVYPQAALNDPKTWPRARRLDGIAIALVEGYSSHDKEEELRAADLLNRLALYRHGPLAAYAKARPLYERVLAIREKHFGPEHPATANALNDLASLLQDQGDLHAAHTTFVRALEINERVLEPDHLNTAATLNNIANLLRDQRALSQARVLYERALAIYERKLDGHHPYIAATLNNIGNLLLDQGELSAAGPKLERALAIREKALGEDHPDTATSVSSLAYLRQTQGDLLGARALFERALVIRENALGPEHPDTATSINRLASLLQIQGDLEAAQSLFARALEIREKVLGTWHPDTAISVSRLGLLSRAQGDLDRSRRFLELALQIRERVLGWDHPDTMTSAQRLADLLRAQGARVELEALERRMLARR